MDISRTIAAISTAAGEGGIAIVRVSGPQAFPLVGPLFVRSAEERSSRSSLPLLETMPTHTVRHGYLLDRPGGRVLDEVLLVKMAAPRTYTREDVVEIHCHGGAVSAGSVLSAVLGQGAYPAEPGEFTRRAFLNGRIDLAEAEAVMDLIQSHTERSARAALDQLDGRLSSQISAMREALLLLLGTLEVNLDYPEHDTGEVGIREADHVLEDVHQRLTALLATYAEGRILREGLTLVIAGRPNAGKSSLMNRLAGTERSIVTPIPGTTRDVVETYTSLRGLPIRLLDTAGLRESADPVEQIGVSRTLDAMARAELIVAVFDGGTLPEPEDLRLAERLATGRVPVLAVMNKTDVVHTGAEAALSRLLGMPLLLVSALQGTGMEALVEAIVEKATHAAGRGGNEVVLTNARHRHLLDQADARLLEARDACSAGQTQDVLAFLIREAWQLLGRILGEDASEDLLDSIFSRFCLGK